MDEPAPLGVLAQLGLDAEQASHHALERVGGLPAPVELRPDVADTGTASGPTPSITNSA